MICTPTGRPSDPLRFLMICFVRLSLNRSIYYVYPSWTILMGIVPAGYLRTFHAVTYCAAYIYFYVRTMFYVKLTFSRGRCNARWHQNCIQVVMSKNRICFIVQLCHHSICLLTKFLHIPRLSYMNQFSYAGILFANKPGYNFPQKPRNFVEKANVGKFWH